MLSLWGNMSSVRQRSAEFQWLVWQELLHALLHFIQEFSHIMQISKQSMENLGINLGCMYVCAAIR